MFCANCGKEIKDDSTFCVYCGTKVAEEAGNHTEQAEEKKAVLQPDMAVSSVQENRTGKETDTEKIKQIVGKNADYYLKQFESIRQTGKGKLNWAAFFLGPFHVGYRNNWKGWWKAVRLPALCTLGCGILAGIISFFQMMIGMVLMFVMYIFAIWLGIAQILYALHFNKIYMQHVEQKVSENNLKTDTSIGRGILTYLGFCAIYMIIIGFCTAGMFSSIFGRNDIDDWDTDIEDYMKDFEAGESDDITEQLPENIGSDKDSVDSSLAEMDESPLVDDTYQGTYNPESDGIIKEDVDTTDLDVYLGTLHSIYDKNIVINLYVNDAGYFCSERMNTDTNEKYYLQIYDTYMIEDDVLYGYVGDIVDEFDFWGDGHVEVLLNGAGSTHYQSYVQDETYFNE